MIAYDKYYEVESLFGSPYPELISYMANQVKGTVLDLGCGQGRDAIALARLGFDVVGVDHSKIGINQMMRIASKENLSLKGQVADIFGFNDFTTFDFVLLDSMFHFAKKDVAKETKLIKNIIGGMKANAQLVVCIQDSGKKVKTLLQIIEETHARSIFENQFVYEFEDKESGHKSKTNYQLIVLAKRK
ncbi:MAG: methyltransferase domain-containing protein [Reichenbachiella sp.]|uniref:class I SAM-dependent methyltransferase n=1 Tax=Reichenbachiella sp. TaxID=2184521 RepID=UPI0032650815